MPAEYHFEKEWFLYYLFAALFAVGWLVAMLFPAALAILFWRERRRNPSGKPSKMPWQAKLLCLLVPIGGTALAGAVALMTCAPYLTRFDTEGVTHLSATGWKREL